MTAIYGLIGTRGRRFELSDLRGISACLEPWGAADEDVHEVGRLSLALGERAPGSRAVSATGSNEPIVAFDGRLTRRAELVGTLGVDAGIGDRALIATAYRRWGRELPQHLDGQFALVVADPGAGGVLLARDHVGARSLAWHRGPDVVAFASHALALTGFNDVGHRLDEQRAVEVLTNSYGTGRTFVEGVRMLEPGSAAWVSDDRVTQWRWWPSEPFRRRDLGSLREHADELRAVLEDAVAASTEGAERIGVLLSGGLDSSSVAAIAASQTRPDVVRSYTLVPPNSFSGDAARGQVNSERPEVEALARRWPNLSPTFVPSRSRSLFDNEILWELGAPPLRNPLAFSSLFNLYQDACADGIDVLLSGRAGNFGFSAGGDLWLAQLARRGRLLEVRRQAQRWAERNGLPLRFVYRHFLAKRIVPTLVARRDERRESGRYGEILEASGARRDRIHDMGLSDTVDFSGRPRRRNIADEPEAVFASLSDNAQLFGAMDLLFGLREVDPTADRRLLEVTATQPDWWRNVDGVWRAIARESMRDVLPSEIVDRREIGAQLPDWLDILNEQRSEVDDELEAMRDHPASREAIDVDRIERLVADWPTAGGAVDMTAMLRYREALTSSIGVSRYLRWFEERGERIQAGGPAVIRHDPYAEFS